MSRATTIAIRITRSWVAGYTRGLDPQTCAERRAELESDIWEQSHDGGSRAGLAILCRCLLGIPADVSWRLEQANPGALGAMLLARVEATGSWITRRGLPRLTMVIALLALLIGVVLIATAGANGNRTAGESIGGGIVFILAGAFMLAGIQAAIAQPRAGALMVTLGVAPVGLVFWATVVVPLTALAVSAGAWHSARNAARA